MMTSSAPRPAPGLQTRLRTVRQARRLRQEGLARAAGVSRQTIVSLEKGRSAPSLALALRLAQVLQVPVDVLFWLEEGGDERSR